MWPGEASDSSSDSGSNSGDDSDSANDVFDDGLDDNLIGDENDRAMLENMTEKEREQELFNRVEKREVLKTRFDIEKKLRIAKRADKKKKDRDGGSDSGSKSKDKTSKDKSALIISSDRKKTLEENKAGPDWEVCSSKSQKRKQEDCWEERGRSEEERRLFWKRGNKSYLCYSNYLTS